MPKEAVTAPIPGKVVRVNTSAGARINEGDSICEIESMKMENPILAPVSGIVKELAIQPGKVVKTGELLAEIEY